MSRGAFSIALGAMATVVAVLAAPLGAQAATPPAGPPLLPSTQGADVSFPQCDGFLPLGQAFAVIGVNDGLATTTNPCLTEQLLWASTSTGVTAQPGTALYVNTANPGLQADWWPSENRTRAGDAIANPYGTCAHTVGAPCSYVYGYSVAYDDTHIRGIDPAHAADYRWWLDVETSNSWSFDTRPNAAVLEGMVAAFAAVGAEAGIYSSRQQWNWIVGTLPTGSPLNGLPSWIAAGTVSSRAAQEACSVSPLTPGGRLSMVQFIDGAYDADVSCLPILPVQVSGPVPAPVPSASATSPVPTSVTSPVPPHASALAPAGFAAAH
ncbi:hypothetical protein [uncultured Amnibacterium sp.]|uniref:hypothetical protein n=1 Tax=uncultured Amnibacterium sp. TaxID=1631851 RepID=UPI0035CACE6C